MKIKTVLKRLLFENDMTVAELSRQTGVPRQTVDNWLSGQDPRSFNQVKSVARHFGVSLDELCFDEKGDSPTLNDFDNEIYAGEFEVILRRIKK